MSSPIKTIQVKCPNCGHVFPASYRASMNLQLDDFSEEYIESMSSAKCPLCARKVPLGSLVVTEDGTFSI